jgi:phosphoribosylformylglycinamidine synthase
VKKAISPVIVNDYNTTLYYIDFSFDKMKLGGSALYQTLGKIGNDCPQIVNSQYFKNVFETIQNLIQNDLMLAGHDISAGGLITTLLEMCFANQNGGLNIDFEYFTEKNLLKILFAENPAVVIQVKNCKEVDKILKINKIHYIKIGKPFAERLIDIKRKKEEFSFSINDLRDVWYETSYFFDKKQSGELCARARFENYKKQPLKFDFKTDFSNKNLQIVPNPTNKKCIAAILRDKGTNGEREMAYALYLAGFEVKDVHLSDLISGRETLENVNFIVFCGGFSNSDVFGSAKGWAGGILFNEKAKTVVENFYRRTDTLSLGVCNGCQLMVELAYFQQNTSFKNIFGKSKMLHNDSHKFESEFISVEIPRDNSVLFGSLSGSKLGIWVAHGEGKFYLPEKEENYNIVLKYAYPDYPANPNGSDYNVAGICSTNGRHLAMMPHLERAIFPWQWAFYPPERKKTDKVTPWLQAFVNARQWIEKI